MDKLFLEITTPDKTIFSENIVSLIVPGTIGSFEVLKNHAPIISTIEVGEIKVTVENNTTQYYATSGGTIEVLNNKIIVLADAIEPIEDINIDRSKSSKKRAFDRLNKENIDKNRALASLKRAENRLKILKMRLKTSL